MNLGTLKRALVLLAVLAAGLWLATATEWVEEQVPAPPRGEAARNRFFAAELLARQLGAQVLRQQGLDAMPPPGARLLLDSPHWDLFPERAGRLRRWVEGGGHLVLPAGMAGQRELAAWLPVETVAVPRGSRAAPPPPPAGQPPEERFCRQLQQAAGASAAGSYRLCVFPFPRELQAKGGIAPQWQMGGRDGVELLRVPLGRGSVTVYGPGTLMHNPELLRADHGAIAAAALQLERGAVLWLVTEEARQPLLPWVWQNGWVAVLLVLAAALAGVWRSAVRFGPVGAVPPLQRRSMKEQLAGTGEFLRHRGSAALHGAQVRALHEAARARIPGYAQLHTAAAMEAIARQTALDAAALQRALKSGPRRPDRLPADLELLEAARRRLARNPLSRSS